MAGLGGEVVGEVPAHQSGEPRLPRIEGVQDLRNARMVDLEKPKLDRAVLSQDAGGLRLPHVVADAVDAIGVVPTVVPEAAVSSGGNCGLPFVSRPKSKRVDGGTVAPQCSGVSIVVVWFS